MKWPFTYDAHPNLVGLIYTVFRFTIRIMVQGSDVLDENTLLLAQEGILYVAARTIAMITGVKRCFKFRESRFANVWCALYMRMQGDDEFQGLPRLGEGILFFRCFFSVLCSKSCRQIHVLGQSQYTQVPPEIDIDKFCFIPPPRPAGAIPFEFAPRVCALTRHPFVVPTVIADRNDFRRNVAILVPVYECKFEFHESIEGEEQAEDQLGLIAETHRMALVESPVPITPVIQYYQNLLIDDVVRERCRHMIELQWKQDRWASRVLYDPNIDGPLATRRTHAPVVILANTAPPETPAVQTQYRGEGTPTANAEYALPIVHTPGVAVIEAAAPMVVALAGADVPITGIRRARPIHVPAELTMNRVPHGFMTGVITINSRRRRVKGPIGRIIPKQGVTSLQCE